jgi:hypothetical protein
MSLEGPQNNENKNDQVFSNEGLLNRNFGKKTEKTSENIEEREKPVMQTMIESYENISNDPEKVALETLFDRLDPSMTFKEKQNAMAKIREEYKLYKEGKDWKQN